MIYHASQHQPHVRPVSHPLHVVTAISNPERFRSRYDLYRAFEKQVEDAGAVLTTVELALGERHHEVTDTAHPRHVQVRSPHELWHKENLLNVGISRLPADWRYVSWVDADVSFARPDWAAETIHQLQHFDVVQMFSHAQDLGPDRQPIGTAFRSFLSSWEAGIPLPPDAGSSGGYGRDWHSGFAWAARRSAVDTLGGLGDVGVLGSGDRHMAEALVGHLSLHGDLTPGYRRYWERWQDRALALRKNVGHVPGLLLHHWHGTKRNRQYKTRWQVLIENGFDPDMDLKYDSQGVLQFTPRNAGLRDGVRRYFRQRNEDGVDL